MRATIHAILICLIVLLFGCGPSSSDNTRIQSSKGASRNNDVKDKDSGDVIERRGDGAVVREGVFVFQVPRGLSRIPLADLERLKTGMIASGRELAIMSDSADPELFKKEYLRFFSGYQSANGQVMIIMAGEESPVSMNREEMFRTNEERIDWGKNAGQLSGDSKGVTKLSIDGVPALLMDIVSLEGERLQTYTFFHSSYPKHSFAITIKCPETERADYAQRIETFIDTLRLHCGTKDN